MALTKQHASKTMSFGEHRDLKKVVTASATVAAKQKRVNVNLDEDVHQRFKAACANKNTLMSDVIKELIDTWMEANE